MTTTQLYYGMQLQEYSENSVVIRGENTKEYKDKLKELGGKWNSNLRDGGGWIFSNKHKDVLQDWLDTNTFEEEDINLQMIDYSEKSFVVRGNTKKYKDKLKELGGKWNSNLKDGGGWIFSNIHKEKVNNWICEL